jgi:succinate dehydrogenase/fumarate reductase cytochrome b subunit
MTTQSSCGGSGCNCGSEGSCACSAAGASHGSGGGGHSRRLCQIHGLVGLYLCGFVLLHLGVGALAVRPELYASVLSIVHEHPAQASVLSLVFVLLPLAVQTTTGVIRIGRGGLRGHCQHGPLPSWVQRVTGLVVLGFLGLHLLSAKVLAPFDAGRALASAAGVAIAPTGQVAINCALALLTVVALWAVAFHVGNGACSAIRFVISRPAIHERTAWRSFCAVVGLVVLTAGLCAWTALLVRPHVMSPTPLAKLQQHDR